jgi:hypothetical protein
VERYNVFVHLPHIRNSSPQGAIYIVCLLFVFSYIAFDVLDLDGSNFPRLFNPVQRSSIVAVIPSDAEIPYSTDRGEHAPGIAAQASDTLTEYTRLQMTRLAESSLFASPRAHGYRTGLARDDLPD